MTRRLTSSWTTSMEHYPCQMEIENSLYHTLERSTQLPVTRDDTYTDSVTPDGVLVGLCHHCPLCLNLLAYNSMPDVGETYWHCPECGWWKTSELIEALMKDE